MTDDQHGAQRSDATTDGGAGTLRMLDFRQANLVNQDIASIQTMLQGEGFDPEQFVIHTLILDTYIYRLGCFHGQPATEPCRYESTWMTHRFEMRWDHDQHQLRPYAPTPNHGIRWVPTIREAIRQRELTHPEERTLTHLTWQE